MHLIRYGVERDRMLQPLQSLAGVGQTTANTLGSAGQAYGTSAGKLYSATGENQGNALMAGANARSSAYGAAARLLPQMNFSNPFASNVSGAWNPATGTFGG